MIVLFQFQFPFLNGQWSDIYPQYIIFSCILMFGLGALIFLIIKLCQTKDVNICGQNDMENATKNGKGGLVEERLYKKTSLYSKFEFSFSVTLCLPFKELFFSVFQ